MGSGGAQIRQTVWVSEILAVLFWVLISRPSYSYADAGAPAGGGWRYSQLVVVH
jgi:hypothetical protein